MIEITVLVMVIMVMVVDTIVFRGLRRRMDACVLDLHNRLDIHLQAIGDHKKDIILLKKNDTRRGFEIRDIKFCLKSTKCQRDLDYADVAALTEYLGVEFYTEPQKPAARCVRKKPVEGEEPTP